MKKKILIPVFIFVFLLCAAIFTSCSDEPQKTALKVIIIPKIELGEMTGDFPGEAQLFYEEYCAGREERDRAYR